MYFPILLVLAFLLVPSMVWGQDDTSYVVPDIEINITAGSIEATRREALLTTRQQGFERLLRALTLREDHPRLPQLASADVRLFAQGVDVNSERFTQDSYYALMSWRFDKKLVRELLQHLDIPFVGDDVGKVIILPIYSSAGVSLLWDDNNQWLQAWRVVPLVSPFYRHVIPDDAPLLSSETESDYYDDLKNLAQKRLAKRLVVAIATPTYNADKQLSLLTIDGGEYQFSARLPVDTFSLFVTRQRKESEDDVFLRAAEITQEFLEQRWKKRNLVRFDAEQIVGNIDIKVLYQGFADWIDVKKRLQSNPSLSKMDVATLSRDHAVVNVFVSAGIEDFQRQLARQGLSLDYADDEDTWILSKK